MADTFDPYHKWLGIPPEEQPPNHYRLLAIPRFESDRDVISNAAVQRMAHLRTYQLGPHSALSQKIINELASAKLCLLVPEKKAAYDAKLRGELELARRAAAPSPAEATADAAAESVGVRPSDFVPAASASPGRPLPPARRHLQLWHFAAMVAAPLVIVLGIVAAAMLFSGNGDEKAIPPDLGQGAVASRAKPKDDQDKPFWPKTDEQPKPGGGEQSPAAEKAARPPLPWLGYVVRYQPDKAIPEIAPYTNLVIDQGWMTYGDALIRAARAEGLKVAIMFYGKDDRAALEGRGIELIRRNRDVVFAVCWSSPYNTGDTPADVSAFGRAIKESLPGIEFWTIFTDVEPPKSRAWPVPDEVDVVLVDFLYVFDPRQVHGKAEKVLPGWIAKAKSRPVVLFWTCWEQKPPGIVPKCRPRTMKACGEMAKKFGLAGVLFDNYGSEVGADGLGLAGLQTNPALVAEIKALGERTAAKDTKAKWWREARFGMYIHWGVYSAAAGVHRGSQISGQGEWIMHNAKIPVAEYKAYAERFNPVKYHADEWVQLAEQAGMKYIVVTAKHSDGFAMFDSKASDWNVVAATPFKRDALKELAAACRKRGIKLGFYYSHALDWCHPGGGTAGRRWDKAQEGSFEYYLHNVAAPQVRELLTNYGEVAVLSWDSPVGMNKNRADVLLPLLKLQPSIITNNRLGGGYRGDFEAVEQSTSPDHPGRDWEACMTMNDTWGYKSDDDHWKSAETLIRSLVDAASKGGNYLLNVGPTAEGVIPEPSVVRLKEIGRWMKANGEAIYTTSAGPLQGLPWGRCTKRLDGDGATLYLHVFHWPADGRLSIDGLKNTVEAAYLLADPSKTSLRTEAGDAGLTIRLPPTAPDPTCSVVVLKVKVALETDSGFWGP